MLYIWQKKLRSTEEKMDRPTSMTTEEAWNDFNSLADKVL
jgi:hypothetical protein